MTTFTEGRRISDVLKREYDQAFNREIVVIDTGVLDIGTVLGKITASGKYVLHDTAANDGSQDACAVLLESVDATSVDVPAVALVRGPAIVADKALIWKTGISAPDKTTGLAALAALGMVARTAV